MWINHKPIFKHKKLLYRVLHGMKRGVSIQVLAFVINFSAIDHWLDFSMLFLLHHFSLVRFVLTLNCKWLFWCCFGVGICIFQSSQFIVAVKFTSLLPFRKLFQQKKHSFILLDEIIVFHCRIRNVGQATYFFDFTEKFLQESWISLFAEKVAFTDVNLLCLPC